MNKSRKRIAYVTYAGVFPFYLSPISDYFDYNEILFRILKIETFSSLYAALIVCFLSGMQWQKLIETNMKGKFFFIPFLPLFLASTYTFYDNEIYSSSILVLSLFLSLLIDLMIYKKKSENWFKKLRISATILAAVSFLI
tara:strand:+ start:338 stop:757 length:420 start_codon:yes stop_codon:yes gene_type:complete